MWSAAWGLGLRGERTHGEGCAALPGELSLFPSQAPLPCLFRMGLKTHLLREAYLPSGPHPLALPPLLYSASWVLTPVEMLFAGTEGLASFYAGPLPCFRVGSPHPAEPVTNLRRNGSTAPRER